MISYIEINFVTCKVSVDGASMALLSVLDIYCSMYFMLLFYDESN